MVRLGWFPGVGFSFFSLFFFSFFRFLVSQFLIFLYYCIELLDTMGNGSQFGLDCWTIEMMVD